MKITDLRPFEGSRKRRKRIGCGEGSGHGGSATRGMKGQRSRSGDGKLVGFEGGQMPLLRRIPKRGFSHKRFTKPSAIFNLGWLEKKFGDNLEINPKSLFLKGLIKGGDKIKILSQGELTKPLNIKAHVFSKTAIEKIQNAKGKYELLKS
ncbi:MAG: 50S ribosomal protein L15 [bacterium]